MKQAALSLASLFLIALLIGSCKKDSDNTTPNTPKPTLYDSLGGTALVADPTAPAGTKIEQGRLTIRNIIDSTIFVIAADTRINGHFTVLLAEVTSGNTSGFVELSDNLTDFVAVGTGAKNYTYTGMSMTEAHNPATNPRMNGKATNADMDAFEDDLVKGAAKNGITTANQALVSVAHIVESLRTQVVQQ